MYFTTLAISTLATTGLASRSPHRRRQVQAEVNYFTCDGSLDTAICCAQTESTSGVCSPAEVVGTVESIDVASCSMYQGHSTYAWCCAEYQSSPVPFSGSGSTCDAGQVFTSVIELVNAEKADLTS